MGQITQFNDSLSPKSSQSLVPNHSAYRNALFICPAPCVTLVSTLFLSEFIYEARARAWCRITPYSHLNVLTSDTIFPARTTRLYLGHADFPPETASGYNNSVADTASDHELVYVLLKVMPPRHRLGLGKEGSLLSQHGQQ